MERFPGYTLVRTEDCPEQHGTLTVLTHDVSGATVLLVENEDTNKAFGIGFGTFPSDDTGVFFGKECTGKYPFGRGGRGSCRAFGQ